MKKIIKITLVIIFVLLIYFFVLKQEKKCILDVRSLSGEGHEVNRINEYEYKISFLGELGKLEQVVRLNNDNKIISVNESKTEYNKPFYFEDFEIKSETSNFYSKEELSQVENIKVLIEIFESGVCVFSG